MRKKKCPKFGFEVTEGECRRLCGLYNICPLWLSDEKRSGENLEGK
jgi:hypothetical protein